MNSKKYYKAAIATAVGASAIVTGLPAAQANIAFTDLQQQADYYDAVIALAERGILNGYSDQTFKPMNGVTRAQAAKIIAKSLSLTATKAATFNDVKASSEFAPYIAALAEAKIIKGYEDGSFKPNQIVTRAQMAKMIAVAYKLAPMNEEGLPFADMKKGSEASTYVKALFDNGVTKGKTATQFGPNAPVLRGQLASFITRAETAGTTAVITAMNGNEVTLSTGTYRVPTKYQTLFTAGNAATLTGAEMKFTIANGEITAIQQLQLNAIGTEQAPAIVDFANATFDGKLIVNGQNIELRNATFTKDVIVSNEVESMISMDNVTIEGELSLEEATAVTASLGTFAATKKAPTLTMKNSHSKHMNVKRNDVAIQSNRPIESMTIAENVTQSNIDSEIKHLAVESKVSFELKGAAVVVSLEIVNNPASFASDAKVETMQVNKAEKLEIKGALQVKSLEVLQKAVLVLAKTLQIQDVKISAKEEVKLEGEANIEKVTVESDAKVELNTTGTIANVEATSKDAAINVSDNTKVESVVVPEGAAQDTIIKQPEGSTNVIGEKAPEQPAVSGGSSSSSQPQSNATEQAEEAPQDTSITQPEDSPNVVDEEAPEQPAVSDGNSSSQPESNATEQAEEAPQDTNITQPEDSPNVVDEEAPEQPAVSDGNSLSQPESNATEQTEDPAQDTNITQPEDSSNVVDEEASEQLIFTEQTMEIGLSDTHLTSIRDVGVASEDMDKLAIRREQPSATNAYGYEKVVLTSKKANTTAGFYIQGTSYLDNYTYSLWNKVMIDETGKMTLANAFKQTETRYTAAEFFANEIKGVSFSNDHVEATLVDGDMVIKTLKPSTEAITMLVEYYVEDELKTSMRQVFVDVNGNLHENTIAQRHNFFVTPAYQMMNGDEEMSADDFLVLYYEKAPEVLHFSAAEVKQVNAENYPLQDDKLGQYAVYVHKSGDYYFTQKVIGEHTSKTYDVVVDGFVDIADVELSGSWIQPQFELDTFEGQQVTMHSTREALDVAQYMTVKGQVADDMYMMRQYEIALNEAGEIVLTLVNEFKIDKPLVNRPVALEKPTTMDVQLSDLSLSSIQSVSVASSDMDRVSAKIMEQEDGASYLQLTALKGNTFGTFYVYGKSLFQNLNTSSENRVVIEKDGVMKLDTSFQSRTYTYNPYDFLADSFKRVSFNNANVEAAFVNGQLQVTTLYATNEPTTMTVEYLVDGKLESATREIFVDKLGNLVQKHLDRTNGYVVGTKLFNYVDQDVTDKYYVFYYDQQLTDIYLTEAEVKRASEYHATVKEGKEGQYVLAIAKDGSDFFVEQVLPTHESKQYKVTFEEFQNIQTVQVTSSHMLKQFEFVEAQDSSVNVKSLRDPIEGRMEYLYVTGKTVDGAMVKNYYAVRLNNGELIAILVDSWPQHVDFEQQLAVINEKDSMQAVMQALQDPALEEADIMWTYKQLPEIEDIQEQFMEQFMNSYEPNEFFTIDDVRTKLAEVYQYIIAKFAIMKAEESLVEQDFRYAEHMLSNVYVPEQRAELTERFNAAYEQFVKMPIAVQVKQVEKVALMDVVFSKPVLVNDVKVEVQIEDRYETLLPGQREGVAQSIGYSLEQWKLASGFYPVRVTVNGETFEKMFAYNHEHFYVVGPQGFETEAMQPEFETTEASVVFTFSEAIKMTNTESLQVTLNDGETYTISSTAKRLQPEQLQFTFTEENYNLWQQAVQFDLVDVGRIVYKENGETTVEKQFVSIPKQ